jgi:hypothetical protein
VWIVFLHLEIFFSEPGAPKWYFKKNCTFLIYYNIEKIIGKTKLFDLSMCFQMRPWLLSHSTKPWSYGMCSIFMDPKPQKWRRWLALRGCPYGGEDDQNMGFPCTTSKIRTSSTCKNSSRVNCMWGFRYNVLQPNLLDPVNHPCINIYIYTGGIITNRSLCVVGIISRSRRTIHIKIIYT